MFCPNCGSEERQPIQFCRTCGTNLRAVKTAIQQPDAITASAVSAREEIGRAVASRIGALERAKDLSKVAEEVLPEIEKFLESPEERRLRRLRAGVMTTFIGLGATLFFLVWSIAAGEHDLPWPIGFVPFFIGIAMIVNALFLTVPRAAAGRGTGEQDAGPTTGRLQPPDQLRLMTPPGSVVENTTELLEREPARAPQARDTR